MKVQISLPGKTFLLGEYSVLTGGAALLAATGPRFCLEIDMKGAGSCEGIHPHSPAGKWVRFHSSLFQRAQMKFFDPHTGKGGLGASSAQFIGVYVWSQLGDISPSEWAHKLSPQNALQAYRSVAFSGEGVAPSGSDVMAQWVGGISQFRSQPFQLQNEEWPFADLSFSLWRTSLKVSTHHHLAQISIPTYSDLSSSVDAGLSSFQSRNEAGFIAAVREFGFKLEAKGLIHSEVQPLLAQLRQHEVVLAAKGCGAMGADIIVLFHRPSEKDKIFELASGLGLCFEAESKDLGQGLKIEFDLAESPKSVLGERTVSLPFVHFEAGN